MTTSGKPDQYTVDDLVARICPLLSGHPPEIIGAVLADLLAMLLAGHQGPCVDEFREEILRLHINAVRDLIKPNEQMILERVRKGSS